MPNQSRGIKSLLTQVCGRLKMPTGVGVLGTRIYGQISRSYFYSAEGD